MALIDQSYFWALKPRITFKDPSGTDTYFTFNGHQPEDADILVSYLDCDNVKGETGSYNIIVSDNENIITKDHIRNGKVFIELGKTEASLEHFLIGFSDILTIDRSATNWQQYRISGFGSAIQAAELLLLQRQSAQEDEDDDLLPDPEYGIGRLFQRSLDERRARPLNDRAIRDITGWTYGGVNQFELKTQYLVINEVFTSLWDYWDRLAALEGADWYLDYSNGTEVLTVKHPTKLHSGINIKNGPTNYSDDADKTSYIKGGFTVTEDSSTGAGVRTGLYTTTIIDSEKIARSQVDNGRNFLNQRFISQQVEIPNDQRRITGIALKIERIGEPESPNSRVNGRIILDEDNKPNGNIIGRFTIPLNDIARATNWVRTDDIDLSTNAFQGLTKIWLVLLDRSGTTGDIVDDDDNTVAWHHDADFTAHTAGNYSATVSVSNEEQRDDSNDLIWNVSTNGPKYTYKIYSDIKRMQSRHNPTAARLLRIKEQFIDSSFLKQPTSVNKFLSLNLNPMSKPRISIQGLRVSLPNNHIFRPFEYVSFEDNLSGLEYDLQISSVRYMISAQPGDPQYGTYEAELGLVSSFNPIIGTCNCL